MKTLITTIALASVLLTGCAATYDKYVGCPKTQYHHPDGLFVPRFLDSEKACIDKNDLFVQCKGERKGEDYKPGEVYHSYGYVCPENRKGV